MKNEDFYIGWQDKMSKDQEAFLRRRLTPILLLLPIIAFVLVTVQKPFVDHHFELGQLSTISGTYYEAPFPILVADDGQLPSGLSQNILLVGYGKFGAEGIISSIATKTGNLQGRSITLQGTLIYGDGKTLMELTKKDASLLELKSGPSKSIQDTSSLKPVSLTGEILDPKCYFGVMKPGEGKIHKSCAIRCISGGIPPVLRARSEQNNDFEYYIMVNNEGQPLNQNILPYVGEPVELQGVTRHRLGWNILYADLNLIKNHSQIQ